MIFEITRTWDGCDVPAAEAVRLQVACDARALRLEVDAPLHSDPPPQAPPGATPGLWNHEVVELFVAGPGTPVPYLEIELGPYGHHLVLQLRGVRQPVASELPAELVVERFGSRWRGRLSLDASLLPPRPWRCNAYAIHGVGAGRRYLAWRPLPGSAPDFHQPEHFGAWVE